MSQLFDTLKKAQSEMEVKLREHGKQAFTEHLSDFFKANPMIEAVKWRQYTPHFNDGEACYFGYYGLEVKVPGIKTKYSVDADGFCDEYSIEDKVIKAAVQGLDKDLSGMESALQMAFGDGYEVTATPKGIETEEYEHD